MLRSDNQAVRNPMSGVAAKAKKTSVKAKPDATEMLRRAIETGRLMPSQRLVEAELAEWLGVNRVVIKYALGKLEQEGLVESQPNKGARVRVITEQEALEILQVRVALESLIAGQAAQKATPADHVRLRKLIESMNDAVGQQDYKTYSSHNGALHNEIRQISGHGTAIRVLRSLNAHFVRLQFRTSMFPGRLGESIGEHEAIVDAIVAGDTARAETAMRTHLMKVSETLKHILEAGF
jgi:DNA-binding GntR family transcriptional regulator